MYNVILFAIIFLAVFFLVYSIFLLNTENTLLQKIDIFNSNLYFLSFIDFLGNSLMIFYQYAWLYIPLGIIGVWRWTVWTIKKICSLYYTPIDKSPTRDIKYSIITPVYNEDPVIFKSAVESWILNEPDEIIAVIDSREKTCQEVFKQISINRPSLKMIVIDKPGKRPALAEGIRVAKYEIIALVDSDTIWDKDNRDYVLSPFRDKMIGGVTTRQHPIERKTIWQKITDIFWDMRNYYDLPAQTAMGKSLSCLSGRTSLYRREIISPKLDQFLNEYILGKKKESGEDKCLTRLVQKSGWKTYYQMNAVIYSYAAEDFKTFWSQRLRWSRNSHNSDLLSLWEGWAWKRPYLSFHMIDRFISIFTLFFGPIFFALSLFYNHYSIALSILGLWIFGRGLKIFPHLRRYPKDIVLLPLYIVINFIVAMIKLYALVTIRDQKWIRTDHSSKKPVRKKIKDFILTSEILGSLVIIVVTVLR